MIISFFGWLFFIFAVAVISFLFGLVAIPAVIAAQKTDEKYEEAKSGFIKLVEEWREGVTNKRNQNAEVY